MVLAVDSVTEALAEAVVTVPLAVTVNLAAVIAPLLAVAAPLTVTQIVNQLNPHTMEVHTLRHIKTTDHIPTPL